MYHFSLPQEKLFNSNELIDCLDQNHELVVLARNIAWEDLERDLAPFYSQDLGAPAIPIRIMAGLQILKYHENLSDERLLQRVTTDNAYQAFIGRKKFSPKPPCHRSMMSVFRKRIGEEGCNILLQESIRIHGDKAIKELAKGVIIDSTVQEKFTSFPTDINLAIDVIFQIWKIANVMDIKLRKKSKETVIKLKKEAAFTKSYARNQVKTDVLIELRRIGINLLKELKFKIKNKLQDFEMFTYLYNNYYKALTQEKDDKNKIYSIFEPQIYCICKGKQHVKYEFGTKVSVVTGLYNRLIYDIRSFNENIHDSKTIPEVLDSIANTYGVKPKLAVGDQGYRGRKKYNDSCIITPPKNFNNYDKKDKKELIKLLNRRSDIEEIISHLKLDHRLGRNELHDRLGDRINPILAATASNFKVFARAHLAKQEKNRKHLQEGFLKPLKSSRRRSTRGVPLRKALKRTGPNLFIQNA